MTSRRAGEPKELLSRVGLSLSRVPTTATRVPPKSAIPAWLHSTCHQSTLCCACAFVFLSSVATLAVFRLALVFELMDMNIYELIRGRRHYLPEGRIKGYMYQLLKSMDHMHRNGIFHRDIKANQLPSMQNRCALAGWCRAMRGGVGERFHRACCRRVWIYAAAHVCKGVLGRRWWSAVHPAKSLQSTLSCSPEAEARTNSSFARSPRTY